MNKFYECGICDHIHPWDWDGDCRDDKNRFSDPLDIEKRLNIPQLEQDIYSWVDRIADSGIFRQCKS